MTTSGIEPATFRFVVECLNQLRIRVSRMFVNVLISNLEFDENVLSGCHIVKCGRAGIEMLVRKCTDQ
jgi:hypothetical protein